VSERVDGANLARARFDVLRYSLTRLRKLKLAQSKCEKT
jgi:hypothetical protein